MPSSPHLLILGAFAGLALAVGAALFDGGVDLPLGDKAAARVNDTAISLDEYDRAIEAVSGDKRNPITDKIRGDILERLIEEELLVQRGLDIGLLDSDRDVRKSIVNAMVAYVVASHSGHTPTEEDITSFFADNKSYFAKTERVHVKRLYVSGADETYAAKRIGVVFDRLERGDSFDEVAADLSDAIIPTVPDAPLPARKLRDYIGPTLTDAALKMQVGDVSTPIKSGAGFHILFLVSAQKGAAPTLDEVRPQVVAEFKRRTDDDALRDYLNWLKSEAEIERISLESAP